jgi:hypothetical protein
MRPNAWVEMPKYFGEDPALCIKKWFLHKEYLSYPVASSPHTSKQSLIPLFLRVKNTDLLFNRYKVWHFLQQEDKRLVRGLLIKTLLSFYIRYQLYKIIKCVFPMKYHNRLRNIQRVVLNIFKLVKTYV